jgi:DNA transposition AAA+ family ATPase
MAMIDFQQILASPVLAYEEGLNFFEGKGLLHETLQQLRDDLERHGIEYSIIGAIALNRHGYQRFTTDINLILTREGLEIFHRNWLEGDTILRRLKARVKNSAQ